MWAEHLLVISTWNTPLKQEFPALIALRSQRCVNKRFHPLFQGWQTETLQRSKIKGSSWSHLVFIWCSVERIASESDSKKKTLSPNLHLDVTLLNQVTKFSIIQSHFVLKSSPKSFVLQSQKKDENCINALFRLHAKNCVLKSRPYLTQNVGNAYSLGHPCKKNESTWNFAMHKVNQVFCKSRRRRLSFCFKDSPKQIKISVRSTNCHDMLTYRLNNKSISY